MTPISGSFQQQRSRRQVPFLGGGSSAATTASPTTAAKIVSSGISLGQNGNWASFRTASSAGNTIFARVPRPNPSGMPNALKDTIIQHTHDRVLDSTDFPALGATVGRSGHGLQSRQPPNETHINSKEDFPELPGYQRQQLQQTPANSDVQMKQNIDGGGKKVTTPVMQSASRVQTTQTMPSSQEIASRAQQTAKTPTLLKQQLNRVGKVDEKVIQSAATKMQPGTRKTVGSQPKYPAVTLPIHPPQFEVEVQSVGQIHGQQQVLPTHQQQTSTEMMQRVKEAAAQAVTPGDAAAVTAVAADNEKYLLKGVLPILVPSRNYLPHIALGDDIYRVGLDLDRDHGRKLTETLASPWDETSASADAEDIDPFYVLPSCYNIPDPPAAKSKIKLFSDEVLFYIFYTMPRDELQDAAAKELSNRNWGYHKEWRLWLTKDPNFEPSHCTYQSERGVYIFWDVGSWEKVSKEVVLNYSSLELMSQPLPQFNIDPAKAKLPLKPSKVQQQRKQAQVAGGNKMHSGRVEKGDHRPQANGSMPTTANREGGLASAGKTANSVQAAQNF